MDGMSWTETGKDAAERIWPEASALVYDDAVKARTDHLYARVKDVVTPMEWPAFAPLIDAINQLKALRGATIIGLTRNNNKNNINNSRWIGANEGNVNAKQIIAGLNKSEGQIATFDGGAKQSNDSDISGGNYGGKLSKAHRSAKGGTNKGNTSGNLIGKVGESNW